MFATFLLGALALLLVLAGIEDARTREIANWKNAAIAALAPLWWAANGLPLWPDVAIQFGVALLVLFVFIGAFAIGQMGGGDVKLIAALALWLPPLALGSMIALMALLGGALTALMMADQWVRTHGLPRIGGRGAAVLAGIAAVALGLLGGLHWLRSEPVLWLLALVTLLGGAGILLVIGARWARSRGVVPETPYGVAIAIAALLAMREPILNTLG